MPKIKNSYKFFQNKDCEYFPCHKFKKTELFNCMFCYCPLYFLNENCTGNFNIIETTEGKIKDCTKCIFPHIHNNYDKVLQILKDNKL